MCYKKESDFLYEGKGSSEMRTARLLLLLACSIPYTIITQLLLGPSVAAGLEVQGHRMSIQ